MRVLSRSDIDALLPMPTAIDIVARIMRAVSDRDVTMPLRSAVPVGGRNLLGVMPGALGATDEPGPFGVKLVCLFPDNPGAGISSHQGALVLFEPDHGTAVAMMNADRITAIRTAAASAVATRALARDDARILALIGTGEQAESHLEAMRAVRPLARVKIAGRTPERARAFADRMAEAHPDLDIAAAGSVQEACQDADIICTVTSSATPVLEARWVAPGTHVNAVGASVATKQEIATDLVLASEVFTDYRPSALAQAADIIDALKSGRKQDQVIRAEIGELLPPGEVQPGRSGPKAITLYRSLGVIAQDLGCAAYLAEEAQRRNIGQEVDL